MVTKILAITLFLYALWQFIFGLSSLTQGQGLAKIIWALLATWGGLKLWEQSNKTKK